MKPTVFSLLMFFPVLALLPQESAAADTLEIPAHSAYSVPDSRALRMQEDRGVVNWTDPDQSVAWFGHFAQPGWLKAGIKMSLPAGKTSMLELSIAGKDSVMVVKGKETPVAVNFGAFEIPSKGYHRVVLRSLNPAGENAGLNQSLEIAGPAVQDAHFNTEARRNAASVHLSYKVPGEVPVTAFYSEVTAVEDPVNTFYMACGFSRGYFGMQVNSPVERRIIFSVWDAGSGQDANDRSTVAEENHTKLLAKGEGVHASVFGNEGTGGHSHFKYMWKTGTPQKFVVTATPDGTFTDYSGYWLHPEENQWKLLARFRAPKDGKHLRGLHSFSENFAGDSGHVLRKARYGNQWIRDANGQWSEILKASFSHDGTGKSARRDRFMGVENDQFFLSHGGFVDGFTEFGTAFDRPATGTPPDLKLPEVR